MWICVSGSTKENKLQDYICTRMANWRLLEGVRWGLREELLPVHVNGFKMDSEKRSFIPQWLGSGGLNRVSTETGVFPPSEVRVLHSALQWVIVGRTLKSSWCLMVNECFCPRDDFISVVQCPVTLRKKFMGQSRIKTCWKRKWSILHRVSKK